MKIKEKDEIYKLKLSYKELTCLHLSDITSVEQINHLMYDKDEFDSIEDFYTYTSKLKSKIEKKLLQVHPY